MTCPVYSNCMTELVTEMPRCFSTSIQSEVAWRELLRAFTVPAICMAPPNSSSFSVSVVLPASGWEMMAKVRRRATSADSEPRAGESVVRAMSDMGVPVAGKAAAIKGICAEAGPLRAVLRSDRPRHIWGSRDAPEHRHIAGRPLGCQEPFMAWLLLVVAGLMEVGWAIGLKYTEGFTRPVPSVLTLTCMIGSILLLGVALKALQVGTAYAVWSGLGAVGTAILGIILFGDPAGVARLACIGLIVAGIVGLKLAT